MIILAGRDDWRRADCRIALCGHERRFAPAVLQAARRAARSFAARELNGVAVAV